jgi:hypothetical protein
VVLINYNTEEAGCCSTVTQRTFGSRYICQCWIFLHVTTMDEKIFSSLQACVRTQFFSALQVGSLTHDTGTECWLSLFMYWLLWDPLAKPTSSASLVKWCKK